MPIYEFVCDKCGHQFEQLFASMQQRSLPSCPKCQGPTKKQISAFAAHSTGHEGPCGQARSACAMSPNGDCSSGGCPFT